MSEFPNVFDRIEPLLDSDQAAAYVRVHKKTLQRHARLGMVPGLRVGKLLRFRQSDLDDWSHGPESIPIDSGARPRYPVVNHSCPQPGREE
jgi:excisionase family DNA binding protein